jgi:Transposase DDE domain
MTNARSVVEKLRPFGKGSRKVLGLDQVRGAVDAMFGEDLHAQRVVSLGNGVAGVLNAAVLSVHAIGQAYAEVAGITPKSGTKQIDRTLSNGGIPVDVAMKRWVQFVVAARRELVVIIDWTDFDDDDHTSLFVALVTKHGRATPLAWKTVKKSTLLGRRTAIEHEMIEQLHEWLPPEVSVTLLGDRGFGDQALYALLGLHGWDYVIRFRSVIGVALGDGELRPARDWLEPSGRAKILRGVQVTSDRSPVPAVVLVHDRKMKEAWCLATSLADKRAAEVVTLYGKRFSIEEWFRDAKDIHFGMGLRATHIRNAQRRDRLMLLVAVAYALLVLLGAACEETGLDKKLKANTSKNRTHSLFRQGTYWYRCIPTMREEWARPLIAAYDRIVREHAFFREIFGVI